MAFDAILQRYPLEDVAVVMYHLHIPAPDPMTNPSTLARAESCEVRGTPSYAIDGEMKSGGGGRKEAEASYDTLNAMIEDRLIEKAAARLALDVSYKDGVVLARVAVDGIKSESSEVELQIALVEDALSYSGQNNLRFHPMVVRSLGGDSHRGFEIDPSGRTTIEQSFNIETVKEELKGHLADYEAEHDMTFSQKRYEIDGSKLSVVAFLQDAGTREILQAAYADVR